MRKHLLAAAALLLCATALADDGMWMVNAISKALETRMQERGLALSADEIYNADADGADLCDAVVSLDFACTGSFISNDGLVITNHHCAYSDVAALSTDEHNYLEDGYWAMLRKDEIRIPGKKVQLLKKVLDVTEEVEDIIRDNKLNVESAMFFRKISHMVESKYEDTFPGLTPWLYPMWAGSRYYLAFYKEYDDVRLVAAPPVSIAAFGGDIDNWEWPQHKGDFAIYRVYDNNEPIHPSAKLEISTAGIAEGDFTMVIGYPGKTDRYCSAGKLGQSLNVTLPVSVEVRGERMKILNRWMDSDPSIRLKYSNQYFSLSNVQELYSGEVLCYDRFGILPLKEEEGRQLQQWIDADPARKELYGDIVPELRKVYSAIAGVQKCFTWYKETMISATRLSVISTRLRSKTATSVSSMPGEYASIDLRVEKDLFRYAVEAFLENVDPKYTGEFHKEMKKAYGEDYDAMCQYIWDNSILTDAGRVDDFVKNGGDIENDPLFKFLGELRMNNFNNEIRELSEGVETIALGRRYTRALYAMREDQGIPQYPDANSSMRLTYGTVCPIEPWDAVLCDWKSSAAGILEKYDPKQYEFTLKDDWKNIVGKYQGHVNFISNNDITGGNSGSPVLNAHGKLVGLAFDGNKESLASDAWFTPQYNRCVCVDIRYVLYILKEYAHMDALLSELSE